MPPSTFKSHLGASGEQLRRLASGIDNIRVEPSGAAKSISRVTTFGKDIKDRSLLKTTLRYLSERVGATLRQWNEQAIITTSEKLLEKALRAEKQLVRLIGICISHLTETDKQLDMLD